MLDTRGTGRAGDAGPTGLSDCRVAASVLTGVAGCTRATRRNAPIKGRTAVGLGTACTSTTWTNGRAAVGVYGTAGRQVRDAAARAVLTDTAAALVAVGNTGPAVTAGAGRTAVAWLATAFFAVRDTAARPLHAGRVARTDVPARSAIAGVGLGVGTASGTARFAAGAGLAAGATVGGVGLCIGADAYAAAVAGGAGMPAGLTVLRVGLEVGADTRATGGESGSANRPASAAIGGIALDIGAFV